MSEWQPIETAPKRVPIFVWGYRIQGELSPSGAYKYFWRTVGQLRDWDCLDLLEPGCGCVREAVMPHPLKWMPLPDPPRTLLLTQPTTPEAAK